MNTIENYLKDHENKELLRFITCGSVDDGKSTLIGRLLHDTKMIFEDQLAALNRDSKKSGTTGGEIDFALLVDGLESEREQGITIDVAYRYFTTDKRKFIIADTPGHEQYTRNMATGASTADVAIVLIDARSGVKTQTKRHSYIVDLLGVKHIIVAINKMDLVNFEQSVFDKIQDEYQQFAQALHFETLHFVPLSALNGDNIVSLSPQCDWYQGESLVTLLDTLPLSGKNSSALRLPVQWVNRPHLNFRGFCGTIASGEIHVGDEINIFPSLKKAKIREIISAGIEKKSAYSHESVTVVLDQDVDVSRGDMITQGVAPFLAHRFESDLVWMGDSPHQKEKEYWLKSSTQTLSASIESIEYHIDINTLETLSTQTLELNAIARVVIHTQKPLIFDMYEDNNITGSFILIDKLTHHTVAAGMIRDAKESHVNNTKTYSSFERELNALIRKHYPEWNVTSI